MKNIEDYRNLNGYTPMYSYIEGEEHHEDSVDSQNCLYYFLDDEFIKKLELDKKNYWLIDSMVPKYVEKNY